VESDQDNERSETLAMPNLDVRNPPPGMAYAQYEDYLNQEILRANGIALEENALLAALVECTGVLQAAAAHTLGSLGSRAAAPALRQLLDSLDELVQVEAAYALARLGFEEGRRTLERCLGYPVNASIVPSIAAGYLAQLGDPRGFPTVADCFDVEIPAVRIVACKQLAFFLPFHEEGGSDVLGLFWRALSDPEGQVQWQALVQLREVPVAQAKALLERYLTVASDAGLRAAAQDILQHLG
jgi:HEAT repeat protein